MCVKTLPWEVFVLPTFYCFAEFLLKSIIHHARKRLEEVSVSSSGPGVKRWLNNDRRNIYMCLAGGFKHFFNLYLGKWSILTNTFQMGWNHQLGVHLFVKLTVVHWLIGGLGNSEKTPFFRSTNSNWTWCNTQTTFRDSFQVRPKGILRVLILVSVGEYLQEMPLSHLMVMR